MTGCTSRPVGAREAACGQQSTVGMACYACYGWQADRPRGVAGRPGRSRTAHQMGGCHAPTRRSRAATRPAVPPFAWSNPAGHSQTIETMVGGGDRGCRGEPTPCCGAVRCGAEGVRRMSTTTTTTQVAVTATGGETASYDGVWRGPCAPPPGSHPARLTVLGLAPPEQVTTSSVGDVVGCRRVRRHREDEQRRAGGGA